MVGLPSLPSSPLSSVPSDFGNGESSRRSPPLSQVPSDDDDENTIVVAPIRTPQKRKRILVDSMLSPAKRSITMSSEADMLVSPPKRFKGVDAEPAQKASIPVMQPKDVDMPDADAPSTTNDHQSSLPIDSEPLPDPGLDMRLSGEISIRSPLISNLEMTEESHLPVEEHRSSRRRQPPARMLEESPQADSPAPTKPKFSRKAPLRGNFAPEYLMQNPKSKLTSVNLIELLSDERAWSALSATQQDKLSAMLPSHISSSNGSTTPSNPIHKLRHNSAFQTALRLFQEDLSAGRYEPTWLKDAAAASAKRAAGDFDSWKEQDREQFWGQKQKVDWAALTGDSGQHSLTALVDAGVIEVGDVWVLYRCLGKGKNALVVEKEAKVVSKSDNLLTFSFPPSQHKFSAPDAREDVVLPKVNNPKQLSDAMLAEDGRIKARGANAWKEFRCVRVNQDMGSLWDARELYHQRSVAKGG